MSYFVVLKRKLPEWKNRVEFDHSLLNSNVVVVLTNDFMYRKSYVQSTKNFSMLAVLYCWWRNLQKSDQILII